MEQVGESFESGTSGVVTGRTRRRNAVAIIPITY